MRTIEPCCTQKHWPQVLEDLKRRPTVMMNGYGDMTLCELLPVMLERYAECEVMVVVPTLPPQLREVLDRWARQTWGDGSRAVAQMWVITDARESKSPGAAEWSRGAGVAMASCQQNDTAVVVRGRGSRGESQGSRGESRESRGESRESRVESQEFGEDVMVTGAVNVRPSGMFTAVVTRDEKMIAETWAYYNKVFEAWKIGENG